MQMDTNNVVNDGTQNHLVIGKENVEKKLSDNVGNNKARKIDGNKVANDETENHLVSDRENMEKKSKHNCAILKFKLKHYNCKINECKT